MRGEIIRPFGPSIGKYRLPKDLIKDFNNDCDKISADEELSLQHDMSDSLVGKVSQEPTISTKVLQKHYMFFHNIFADFVKDFNKLQSPTEGGNKNLIGIDSSVAIKTMVQSAWYVRSFAGDYNPFHMHPGAVLSCAGYLKTPDWEEELNEDMQDHHGLTHGCLAFKYGDHTSLSLVSHVVRPRVGDFYVFPAWLQHGVYPFKSPGERRTFSINVVTQFAKQES